MMKFHKSIIYILSDVVFRIRIGSLCCNVSKFCEGKVTLSINTRDKPMSQASGERIGSGMKAGAGAAEEFTHKVRIFRKCLNFLP